MKTYIVVTSNSKGVCAHFEEHRYQPKSSDTQTYILATPKTIAMFGMGV